jgi:hypothetical protein
MSRGWPKREKTSAQVYCRGRADAIANVQRANVNRRAARPRLADRSRALRGARTAPPFGFRHSAPGRVDRVATDGGSSSGGRLRRAADEARRPRTGAPSDGAVRGPSCPVEVVDVRGDRSGLLRCGGESCRVLGAATDVTARRAAEEALRESDNRYRDRRDRRRAHRRARPRRHLHIRQPAHGRDAGLPTRGASRPSGLSGT